MAKRLETGDAAPDFTRPADDEGEFTLSSLRGRKVVLFFYPKDDTAGCTKEAIAFTGALADFEKADTEVIGISRDSAATHDKFKAKHALGVRLVADVDGGVCENFGVWVEKSMYGRKYLGIERSTFLIDAEGVVRHVWRKVRVPGHAEDVLDKAKGL